MSDSNTTPRPPVAWFAEVMERKLKENDHKGGWDEESIWSLMARIAEEFSEVYEAALPKPFRSQVTTWLIITAARQIGGQGHFTPIANPELAIDELADVANFCMMVADRLHRNAYTPGANDG